MSRYYIQPLDLKRAAYNLNLGEGTADRFNSADMDFFIESAENEVDAKVAHYIATPLKPIPAPGTSQVPSPQNSLNFPQEFINAIVYNAVFRALNSEFFESEPNRSEVAKVAMDLSEGYLQTFRSRPTVLVGAGRRRHPNPHMPPNIAPMEQTGQGSFGMGN